MRNTEEIVEVINDNSKLIIDKISNESIDVYNFLKTQFDNTNILDNYLFQFVYRSFYRLDNAGLTPQFKTEYFNILQESRQINNFDFSTILQRLYKIPNHRNLNTFQFSFVTKMQNTIYNDRPIYDSEVAEVFSFARPRPNLSFDKRVNTYLEQLTIIENTYNSLIQNQKIKNTIDLFESKFPNHNLHPKKVFDFIFWSAGKVIRQNNSTGIQ